MFTDTDKAMLKGMCIKLDEPEVLPSEPLVLTRLRKVTEQREAARVEAGIARKDADLWRKHALDTDAHMVHVLCFGIASLGLFLCAMTYIIWGHR